MTELDYEVHPGMSVFAQTSIRNKYLDHTKSERTWTDVANRVARAVVGPIRPDLVDPIAQLIIDRKFLPGGRYLANAGRSGFLNNCFAGETRIITNEGAKEIGSLVGTDQVILSRGEWVKAPIMSFGEQPLKALTVKRSGVAKTIFVTDQHRWFVNGEEVVTSDLRAGDALDSEAYQRGEIRPTIDAIRAGMVFGDGTRHPAGKCHIRLCGEKGELANYFTGFNATTPPHANGDIVVHGLPGWMKDAVSIHAGEEAILGWLMGYFATDGCVSADGQVSIASTDYETMTLLRDLANKVGISTYGIRPQERISNLTGKPSTLYSVRFNRATLPSEFFLRSKHAERFEANPVRRDRSQWTVVAVEKTDRVEEVFCAVVEGTAEFALEDNIATGNCFLYRVGDSRQEIAHFNSKITNTGMTGGGVGAVWSDLRPNTSMVSSGGESTGPVSFMQGTNETGRSIVGGGGRRMALWAGLHWWHPDVFEFMKVKDWSKHILAAKSEDFSAYAPMDMTNISVILDDYFFAAFEDPDFSHTFTWEGDDGREVASHTVDHEWAQKVYWHGVNAMLRTGEPGFSVDIGENGGENLRNPCCEITSYDDSDVCCLGSINLARIESKEELEEVTALATIFLTCGTLISNVPHEEVTVTRNKNRRLGLGVMGIHEWLIARGLKYEPSAELGEWLDAWKAVSDKTAYVFSMSLGISTPTKVRAIAPTGTIGIIAETTTGIEPIYALAYKRRYRVKDDWKYQYVVDATAQRIIDNYGVDPTTIQTAYDLAQTPDVRLGMQAFVQQYVDHAISSTINLPQYMDQSFSAETFGEILYEFLPSIRGITVYPDGARDGQPLTVVPYEEALASAGVEYDELGSGQACVDGVCGL